MGVQAASRESIGAASVTFDGVDKLCAVFVDVAGAGTVTVSGPSGVLALFEATGATAHSLILDCPVDVMGAISANASTQRVTIALAGGSNINTAAIHYHPGGVSVTNATGGSRTV